MGWRSCTSWPGLGGRGGQTGPLGPDGRFFSVCSCVFDYDDYVDTSHQEVDRQDELEYEVKQLQPR